MFQMERADPMIREHLSHILQGQYYRLIDPERESVFDYQNGALVLDGACCYEVWGRGHPCSNCISQRAVSEQRAILKLEVAKNGVYLVCATPIILNGQTLSVEVAWNVTDSLVTKGKSPMQEELIADLVERFNVAVLQDAYTGLYNKRFAEETLEHKVQSWTPDKPLSVVMMDIDHFKSVNDLHGHAQGDAVIKVLARMLIEGADSLDGYACRGGGDEFLLILPVNRERAETLLGRIEKELACQVFGGELKFNVTISGGVAEYSPDLGHWRTLMDQADQSMYCEKGRRAETRDSSHTALAGKGG